MIRSSTCRIRLFSLVLCWMVASPKRVHRVRARANQRAGKQVAAQIMSGSMMASTLS